MQDSPTSHSPDSMAQFRFRKPTFLAASIHENPWPALLVEEPALEIVSSPRGWASASTLVYNFDFPTQNLGKPRKGRHSESVPWSTFVLHWGNKSSETGRPSPELPNPAKFPFHHKGEKQGMIMCDSVLVLGSPWSIKSSPRLHIPLWELSKS